MPECASLYRAPGVGMSTVNTRFCTPAAFARSSAFFMKPLSFNTYS